MKYLTCVKRANGIFCVRNLMPIVQGKAYDNVNLPFASSTALYAIRGFTMLPADELVIYELIERQKTFVVGEPIDIVSTYSEMPLEYFSDLVFLSNYIPHRKLLDNIPKNRHTLSEYFRFFGVITDMMDEYLAMTPSISQLTLIMASNPSVKEQVIHYIENVRGNSMSDTLEWNNIKDYFI